MSEYYTKAMEKVLSDLRKNFDFNDKQETILAIRFLMGFLYVWIQELQDE